MPESRPPYALMPNGASIQFPPRRQPPLNAIEQVNRCRQAYATACEHDDDDLYDPEARAADLAFAIERAYPAVAHALIEAQARITELEAALESAGLAERPYCPAQAPGSVCTDECPNAGACEKINP